MTPRTAPVRFSVVHVECRHCGEEIPVDMPTDLDPGAQLAECERQADAKHNCAEKQATAAEDTTR